MRNSFIIFFLSLWIHFAFMAKGKYRRSFVAIIVSLIVHLLILLPFFLQFKEQLSLVYNPVVVQRDERVSLQKFNFSTQNVESASNQPPRQAQRQTQKEVKQAQKSPPEPKAQAAPTPKLTQDSTPKEQTQVPQQIASSKPAPSPKQVEQAQPKQQTEDLPQPQTQIVEEAQAAKHTQEPKEAEVIEEMQAAKHTQEPKEAEMTEQAQVIEQAQYPVESSAQQDTSPSIYSFNAPRETQKIQDLYGAEFGSLSQDAQQFIKENLDTIGKITQRYLRYPLAAGKFGQQGMNIVEFYLHPNGDITELRLFQGTNFRLLDHNSLQTIKVAYKDYPRPNEKTKIRIRMIYEIY